MAVVLNKVGKDAKIITSKIFCIPGYNFGIKRVTDVEKTVVPSLFFGEALRLFVSNWNTKKLPPVAIQREISLWGSFFTNFPQKTTRMAIQRFEDPDFIFEAEMINSEQISNLCALVFEQDLSSSEEVQDDGLRTKEKIRIYIKSRKFFSSELVYDPKKPLEAYAKDFRFYSIDPRVPKLFADASSVEKMIQMDSIGAILYDYSEEVGRYPESSLKAPLGEKKELFSKSGA